MTEGRKTGRGAAGDTKAASSAAPAKVREVFQRAGNLALEPGKAMGKVAKKSVQRAGRVVNTVMPGINRHGHKTTEEEYDSLNLKGKASTHHDLVESERESATSPVHEAYGTFQEKKLPFASDISVISSSETVMVGPVLGVLTSDSTLLLVLAVAASAYPTCMQWSSVRANEMPFSVVASWLLVAFLTGRLFSPQDGTSAHWMLGSSSANCKEEHMSHTPSEIFIEEYVLERTPLPDNNATGHSLLFSVVRMASGRKKKLSFRHNAGGAISSWKKRRSWTSLNPNRLKKQWEESADPTKDKASTQLMKALLANGKFPRIRRLSVSSEIEIPAMANQGDSVSAMNIVEASLGAVDLGDAIADSLNDFVVAPILHLRGMDVFLTENAETDISTHPWLIKEGLRDVPTLIVNLVTQWGNILVYFEMPHWINDWDTVRERDSDPDDIKAFKRFLLGDTKYRNERLKIIPSVVDAPGAVKLVAPAKREIPIHSEGFLPVSWRVHNREKTPEGRVLCPTIECELDCMTSRAIRGMAGLVKRNLKKLAIDCAVIIGNPVKSKTKEEPEACLGLWRFNHVDISECPAFPKRHDHQAGLAQPE